MKSKVHPKPILTVVMYHYVRPIAASRYPNIKGLENSAFEAQLDYIQKHYNPVSAYDVIQSIEGNASLPTMPILLTFDDGYTDHYVHVFRAIKQRGIRAAFFPPVNAVRDRVILDVNKVHFILQASGNLAQVINSIDVAVASNRLGTAAEFKARYMKPSRYDTVETMYVKRMLQFALPAEIRKVVVDKLFEEIVTTDASAFADELYLTEDNLREMLDEGMSVGGHGYSHSWLNQLPDEEQEFEIDQSVTWLRGLGVKSGNLTFCYPFGGYNAHTLTILARHECKFAVTTKVALNDLSNLSALEIARIDTNDLPQYSSANLVEWTERAKTLANQSLA